MVKATSLFSDYLRSIYLDEPIVIDGWTIRHTPAGLKQLISHWEIVLSMATAKQITDSDRAHCTEMIQRYKHHLSLYENQKLSTEHAGTKL